MQQISVTQYCSCRVLQCYGSCKTAMVFRNFRWPYTLMDSTLRHAIFHGCPGRAYDNQSTSCGPSQISAQRTADGTNATLHHPNA